MRVILWLMLAGSLATTLPAQNALWIDLSGPWLSRSGEDRAEFSSPTFDDSRWEPYTLPASNFLTPGSLWLRKTVDLPAGAALDSLALTLGTFNDEYEVFVNGTLAGSSGNFTEHDHQIIRPRTFRLPPVTGSRITIAIRSLRLANPVPGAWQGMLQGPFLLTGEAQAPKDAVQAYFNRLRVRSMMDLAISLLLAGLSLTLLLAWLRERSQASLLWLAGALTAMSALTMERFSGIMIEDFYPYRHLNFEMFLAGLTPFCLVKFIAVVYDIRTRWMHLWLGCFPFFFLLARWTGDSKIFLFTFATLCLAAIPLTAFGWWRSGGWQLTRRQHLLAAALSITLAVRANGFAPLLYRSQGFWGPFSINWTLLSLLVVSIPIAWELLSRLREDGLERERLKREMQAARLVQQLFLAARPNHIDVVYEPAHEVGGDFAFVFPLEDGDHLVAAGDVSGKGLKAAMIVSLIAGALRNRHSNQPANLLTELNLALSGSTDHGFVTALIVRCSPGGDLELASAGHPAPYLAGRELELEAGLPLGISPEAQYTSLKATLQEGTQLTLISDGVVEAENAVRELFGFDRTREISTQSTQDIAHAAKSWGQTDDITVVTIRRSA